MFLNPILIGGALGGILPTLAKLASTYVTVPTTPLPEYGLLFGVLLFAVIGAVIAFATGQSEIRQAMIAGIAAPGIITNLVAGATAPTAAPSSPPAVHSMLNILGTAMAQPVPASPGTPPAGGIHTIVIDPKVTGGLPLNAQIPLSAEIPGVNNTTQTVRIGTINSLSGTTTYSIPATAKNLKIGGKSVPLSGNQTTIQLDVTTKSSAGSDFLWALGGHRSYQVQSIAPTVKRP